MKKEKVWGEAGNRRRFDGKWTDVYQALADEKLGKEEEGEEVKVKEGEEEEEPVNTESTWKEFKALKPDKQLIAQKLEEGVANLSEEEREQYLSKVKSSWEEFYQHNADKFFKNRNYLPHQFPELKASQEPYYYLEMGCGAGNSIIPLIQLQPNSRFSATDLAPTAVEVIQKSPYWTTDRCKAFVCDISDPENSPTILTDNLGSEPTVDYVLMIFFLSAVTPGEPMSTVIKNAFRVMKPGGKVLFRDYGQYDLAQIRFLTKSKPLKLDESFYLRQDGTSSYFFTEKSLEEMFVKEGFEKEYISWDVRELTNRKRKIAMHRVWLQAIFKKPGDNTTQQ